MLNKDHLIPFLIGWLLVGYFLPPQRLLAGIGGKKSS
jgi:hypothetical protein